MVSKAKSIKGSVQGIDYIMREEKEGYELCRNDLIGTNGQEILSEFREVQSLNSTCQNNTFTIVLSPNNDQVHSRNDLLDYTQQHLKNLDLSNHQYIAYVHQNTETTHIHIIANRINDQGKALNDSYIGFKAQASAEEIAKSYGFKTAREIRYEKLHLNNSVQQRDLKLEIYKAHNFSVKSSKNFKNYIDNMNVKGFQIEPVINKGGRLQGFKISNNDRKITFKASEIHKNCSLKVMKSKGIDFSDLNSQLKDCLLEMKVSLPNKPIELVQNNSKNSPEFIQRIKNDILNTHLRSTQKSSNFGDYISKMSEKGLQVEPLINKDGELYSFNIFDQKNRLTFRSNQIHPNCGLKQMLQKGMNFNEIDKQLAPFISKTGKEVPFISIDLISDLKPLMKTTKMTIKVISKLLNGLENER